MVTVDEAISVLVEQSKGVYKITRSYVLLDKEYRADPTLNTQAFTAMANLAKESFKLDQLPPQYSNKQARTKANNTSK
jgi:hypothetical protein